ncbi:hypothetical protein F7U66_00320 [Vibrio parahaemolyticus]|nr:hypothetical protein [Vibrio parahaemolyticus]
MTPITLDINGTKVEMAKVRFSEDPENLTVFILDNNEETVATLFVQNPEDFAKLQAFAMVNGLVVH